MLNNDYKDMLRALCGAKVKFILVGAYALAAHGYPRATMDIDFWIMPSAENAKAVMQALAEFGAPLDNLSSQDFQTNGVVFQIGVAPRRIDMMTTNKRVSGRPKDLVDADMLEQERDAK